MSTESAEPYIRNDRHLLAHVRAQGMYNLHRPEVRHRNMSDFPGHPVLIDAHWEEVSPRERIAAEQDIRVRIVTLQDRLEEANKQIKGLKLRLCPKVGTRRFNPDGTENWCNRNGLDACGICDLHPFLD